MWFSGRWARLCTSSVAVAAVLLVEASAVPAMAGSVSHLAPAAPKARVTQAADLVSARIAARAQGIRVEALSERTDTTTTWVNPTGTITTEMAGAPVRFKDASGRWMPVDLTLKAAGGEVVPSSSNLSVRLSSGGVAGSELAAMDHGRSRAVSWALGGGLAGAKLPVPVLSGRSATYPNVEPGLDVRVSLRPEGFEQDFVIKDRAAADQIAAGQASNSTAGGASFSIPLKTKGLTARSTTDGGAEFVDGKGNRVSFIPPAQAWDSKIDPRTGEPVKVPVKLTVSQANPGNAILTVTPDPAWLADPARQFPVTVDPTYAALNVGTSFDTWVATNYPNNDESTDPELKAGTYDGGTTIARSYLNFPITGFHGYDIVSANLSMYETWSYSCTAKPVSAYSSNSAGSTTRWGSQPTLLSSTAFGTATVAKGFSSSCAAGWINIPVTGLIDTYWSTSTASSGTLSVRASETDSYGWKRFSSANGSNPPKLAITYNRKPNVASAPTLSGTGQSYGGIWYATTLKPTFTSTATDPDGSNVTLTTEVHTNNTDGSATAGVASCVTGSTASGHSAACTLSTSLSDNTTYYARTKVQDDRGLWNGNWSPWTQFKTAVAAPAVSTASCPSPYSNGAWVDTPSGSTASCTVTATATSLPSSPVIVAWKVDGGTQQSGGFPQTVTVPTTNGRHTIEHWSISLGGVSSAHTTYAFGTGSVAMSYPTPNTATPATGPIKVRVTGPPKGTASSVTAALKWRLSGSDQGAAGSDWFTDSTAMPVTFASDGSATVTGVWDVSKLDSDPNTAGVQPAALAGRAPVKLDVQVCLSYDTTVKCTYATAPASVLRVPHAFGNGFPTQAAGPGQVALFTGEFNATATDITVPGYTGTLSLSRSHSTYANLPGAYVPPAASVFGPGWSASIGGSDVGLGQLIPYDGTRDDGTLAFLDEDGTALVYQPTTAGLRRTTADLAQGSWIPADADTRLTGTSLTVKGSGTSTVLTLTEADGTATSFTPSTAATIPTTTTPGRFTATSVVEVGGATTTTTTDVNSGRVTRILAPVPDGMTAVTDCPDTSDLTKVKAGCRALRLVYGTTTNVSSGGTQVAGQLAQVNLEAWAPDSLTVTDCAGNTATVAGGTMASVPVACYSYNASAQLAKVTDPRSNLTTSYGYGSSNQLTSLTPPGLKPYTISYAAPTGTSQLKVTAVTRANASGTGSTSLARFVYGAAPSATNSLAGTPLPDLSAATVARWGQDAAPTYAAAVFGPDYTGPVPDALTGAGTGIDWTYADLTYTDPQGYVTDTATFGAGQWLYGYTDYDELGNVVFTLGQHATAKILADAKAGTSDNVASLGTTTIYNSDSTSSAPLPGQPGHTPAGAVVTDVYAPARTVTMTEGPDVGTQLTIRPRTHTDYDQGAPNGGLNPASAPAGAGAVDQKGYALPTTVTVYAADSTENAPPASTTAPVISRTLTGYASKSGSLTDPDSGWSLGKATKTVTDMDLSGTENSGDIVAVTYYDALGRTVESRQPSESTPSSALPAAGAGTTLTSYYTAGANPDSDCKNAAWAGQLCRTRKAAQPTGTTLPDSLVKAYSYLLAPTTTTETSGTVVRTSTTAYLLDGRADTTTTSVTGLASSTPLPGTKTIYDPATGIATGTSTLDPGGNPTTPSSSSSIDGWGRAISTTSSQNDTTTTSFDAAGRVEAVTDPKGVTRYTYDGTDAAGAVERRGLVTKVTVSRSGLNETAANLLTYRGAYDDAGALTTETMPGGLTQDWSFDEVGQTTGMTYSGQVTSYTTGTDPVTGEPTYTPGTVDPHGTWLAWTQERDAMGKVVREFNGPSAAFDGNPGVTDPGAIGAPTGVGDARAADRAYGYDRAGRLTSVNDRIAAALGVEADPATPASDALPCTVRTYGFNSNGNRTSSSVDTHGDGNCGGTADAHTATTYSYDTADRPTAGGDTGTNGPGAYSYDPFGRQTTIPAVDAPDPSKGDITLGYYDTDMARTITQGTVGSSTTTTYTLDEQQRRTTSVTGPTGSAAGAANTTTTVRHYTGRSDNPAWTDVTTVDATGTAQPTVTSRYTQTLTGDLGAQIGSDGSATLSLGNPHGDAVTTVTIPAGTDESTAAVCINGWTDYTEYGGPTDTTSPDALATVGGSIGYGWLGLKERATPTEAAGLTLMGVRLYNYTRGSFTSLDPVAGGNTTAYTYPQDPINRFDLDGRCWSWGWACSAANRGWAATKSVASRAYHEAGYLADQWVPRFRTDHVSWGPALKHHRTMSWWERMLVPEFHIHWDYNSSGYRGVDFYPTYLWGGRFQIGRKNKVRDVRFGIGGKKDWIW